MLGILDYILFALNLGIGAAVGVYYLFLEKKKAKKEETETKNKQDPQEAFFLDQNEKDEDAESTQDYFIDSHGTMSPFQVACSMFSSNYSSISLLGLPG